MNIAVISFPRSGSNFFMTEFSEMTGILLRLSHGTLKREIAVSCIRNPEDTLSSLLAMKLTEMNYKFDIVPEDKVAHDISRVLESMAAGYKRFYQYLIDSKNIIVDYKTFCADPPSYVQRICNKLNIDVLENRVSIHKPKDNPERGYLVSSAASSKYYEAASKAVKSMDLKKLELLYEMALSKSLSL